MTRRLTLLGFLVFTFCVSAAAQSPSPAAREKLIRETYRKLEIYNAAAQVFQKEQATGRARAEAKLTLCNLAYNFNRLIFHERRESMG